jgi:hypothetical protein
MLGNHEADLPLHVVQARIEELAKSAKFINTNLRNPPPEASWMVSSIAHERAIIRTSDDRVKVALTAFLSDEPDMFYDDKFKGIPVSNVLDTFSSIYKKVVPSEADFVLPMTHQSLARDMDLAQHMLSMNCGRGLIIGGHEHFPIDETVMKDSPKESIRILKGGSDAQNASLIDLCFDTSATPPVLKNIDYTLVDLTQYDDSLVVKKIAESHLSVLEEMNEQVAVQVDNIPQGKPLSSERSRFEQTTVGSHFCKAIKEELEADVALLNGGSIKGNMTYENNSMSYAQLKKELPFPTKIVVVRMSRSEVKDAIYYSRDYVEEGATEDSNGEIPRRGYLQVNLDLDLVPHAGDHDDILKVALPRNLLTGFCKNQPLMDTGLRLKAEGYFPGEDDFIPALDLVVRHCAKSRWFEILNERNLSFEDLDLNGDGVLDRDEVKKMMERFLGHEPADFVVDNMIASLDDNGSGTIDVGELSYLIASMEREHQWRNF